MCDGGLKVSVYISSFRYPHQLDLDHSSVETVLANTNQCWANFNLHKPALKITKTEIRKTLIITPSLQTPSLHGLGREYVPEASASEILVPLLQEIPNICQGCDITIFVNCKVQLKTFAVDIP